VGGKGCSDLNIQRIEEREAGGLLEYFQATPCHNCLRKAIISFPQRLQPYSICFAYVLS
jgi:hypothetical protein